MISPAFHIDREQPTEDECLQSHLLLEISAHGMSYLVLHPVRQEVLDAKYYNLPGQESKSLAERLRSVIDSDAVLHNQFRQSTVLFNFPESMLVPESVFNLETNRDLVELTFGTVAKGLVLSEKVPSHPAHAVYRIAADIHSFYQQKFSAGKYWHLYSLWLASLQRFLPEAAKYRGHVLFYPDKMLVAVYKNDQLQLVQTYVYQVAEDVVYYLLNTCRQLDISPDEILLLVSGYVQHDSPVYTEIMKYFLQCKLDEVPEPFNADAFHPLPAHFFSPLLKMALCV
jgi:hypothetical protein